MRLRSGLVNWNGAHFIEEIQLALVNRSQGLRSVSRFTTKNWPIPSGGIKVLHTIVSLAWASLRLIDNKRVNLIGAIFGGLE